MLKQTVQLLGFYCRLRLSAAQSSLKDLPPLPNSYKNDQYAATSAPTIYTQTTTAGGKALGINAHGHAETNPGVRPIGPVRVRSLREKNSLNFGAGDQYTEEMYRDLRLPEASKPTEGPSYGIVPSPPNSVKASDDRINGPPSFCSFRKAEHSQFESSSNTW